MTTTPTTTIPATGRLVSRRSFLAAPLLLTPPLATAGSTAHPRPAPATCPHGAPAEACRDTPRVTTPDTRGPLTATTPVLLPVAGDPVNPYAGMPSLGWVPAGLRLVWMDGPDHHAYGATRVMTSTSPDAGATWTPPTDTAILGGRDPHIATPPGLGSWLTYFTGVSLEHPATGVYARPSRDNGATWGSPVRVDPDLPYAGSSAPIRATGGTLWMPFYGRALNPAGNVLEEYDSAYIARSNDSGATWRSMRIADGNRAGRDFNEPWLLTACTRLMVFHRHGGWDQIGVTESTDGGRTWTGPRRLFPGTGKPAAARLSTGELVVVYRDPLDRSARYAVSRDCGATWDAGRPLLANTSGSPLGMMYAAPFETSPGRLYTVIGMEESATVSRLWHTTIG